MMTSCNPVRSTRSSHKVNLLVVPHQKSNKYSDKAFAVVGPRLWNELLTDELRGCNSVDTFKKKLKLSDLVYGRTINRPRSRLQQRRHFQKEDLPYKNMLFKKHLSFIILPYILLTFRDYVKNCNPSVDGFIQHVSYFLLHH